MTSNTYALVSGLIAIMATGPAFAQTQPQATAPADTPAQPQTTPEVTVTGERKEVSNRIDRRVYDIKNDPESQTGTATDILAKLPSVQVSPNGRVSLRGDSGVMVLIDGKNPVGPGAIQTLAAADIDRIEVITNPSAQYAPEGTSGIINIITKRRFPTGISGNVNSRLSTQGRAWLGVSAKITKGPWSIDSRVDYFHTPSPSSSTTLQTLPYASLSTYHNRKTDAFFARVATLSYKLSDIDTLSLRIQDVMRRSKSSFDGSYASSTLNYDGSGLTSTVEPVTQVDFTYERNDSKSGAHITLNATHNDTVNNSSSDFQEHYAGGASAIYGNRERQKLPGDNLKGDYEKRIDADHLLTAGFEWFRGVNQLDRRYYDRGSIAGPDSDGYRRLFDGEFTTSSAYTTFQMPLGKWIVLPGLRAERERHTARSGGLVASGGTTKLYPSLHLSHDLSKQTKLKLSYSRRVQRPRIESYDPGVISRDRTSISIGNPALKPTDIDSYEAEYGYIKGPVSYTAAIYYRATTNLQTSQSTARSDGIIAIQPVNAGQSHSGGAELTLKSPLSTHWKYSLSTNLYMKETPLFSGGERDDFAYNINGQLQYSTPAKNGKGADQLQAVFNLNSRQYNPQGYASGGGVLSLIWQHPLSDKVSMVMTAANLIQTPDQVSVINSPGVQSRQTQHRDGQALMIALAYKFGAKPK
jgi:ferric enterobactin receptor